MGFFSRDHLDLAVYVITVLTMAAGAAAMAAVLPELTPTGGPALCTARQTVGNTLHAAPWWTASYNPMWLDGLIAFPLLCLVGEWARLRVCPVGREAYRGGPPGGTGGSGPSAASTAAGSLLVPSAGPEGGRSSGFRCRSRADRHHGVLRRFRAMKHSSVRHLHVVRRDEQLR